MARPAKNTKDVALVSSLEAIRSALTDLVGLADEDALDVVLAMVAERISEHATDQESWRKLAREALFALEGRTVRPEDIAQRIRRASGKAPAQPEPLREIFSDDPPDTTDLPLRTRWIKESTLETFFLCPTQGGGKVWATREIGAIRFGLRRN